MTKSADLLVLGAGPAGLAAAWRAADRGMSVTVLERASQVGGLAASFEVAGIRVDHGSHRLHPATPPALLRDVRELLGADLQTRDRNGRLRVARTWVGFPLRPAELARALPRRMLACVAAETVTAPVRRRGPPSFAATLRHGLGPTLYDQLYSPYARKLWGFPGERIDEDQATKRVTADTPWKVAAKMLRLGPTRRSGQGRVFHYPRRGFGQIVDALAAAAVESGADIRLDTEVSRVISSTEGGVEVRTAAGAMIRAAHVFSTLPMPVLARISTPGPAAQVLARAGRLRFRAMVLVYVVHAGGRWTCYDAHYVPGLETPVTRISEPANYRDSTEDPNDRTVLCFEIPCELGDDVWSASPDELAILADEALARTGLPPVQRLAVEVRRLPHVYPVYEIGYAENLRALDAWAGSFSHVTTFGRLGLFAHDNTHHALAMAYDAVAALGSDGSFDETAWAAARARFASHVVED